MGGREYPREYTHDEFHCCSLLQCIPRVISVSLILPLFKPIFEGFLTFALCILTTSINSVVKDKFVRMTRHPLLHF